LVPDYLQTSEGATNLMDYGVQLGRRFRSLKLWMVIRAFGVEGLRQRIRAHCALARRFAGWVEADSRFELAAPVPFSTVCFRLRDDGRGAAATDACNERLLAAVNASGLALLSQTRLRGRFVLRVAIGNLRTGEERLRAVWALLEESAGRGEPGTQ
jgi:aromatic-L-amino-acid decarboxylase